VSMEFSTRQLDGVMIVDLKGRITLGEGSAAVRDTVRDLLSKGMKRILLNLGGVNYIDSSGVGELVKTHTTIQNKGGELKLANLNQRVHDLLQITRLSAVFDIQKDVASAIQSFGSEPRPRALA